MANIAIGKIGKSMLFDPKKWSAIGGDSEASLIYLNLAKYNPQNTYYIIGKSDYSRMPQDYRNQYPNVIDVWQWYDKNRWPGIPSDTQFNPVVSYIYDILKEKKIDIDYALIMSGPMSGANSSAQMRHADDKKFYTPLAMFQNYVGPIVYYLNKTGLKWGSISVDIRYFPLKARDLFNRPLFSISQYNKTEERWHIKSYEEDLVYVTEKETCFYSGIETNCLIGKKKFDLDTIEKEKTIKLSVLANQAYESCKGCRNDLIFDYVLNNFPNDDTITIYGKWEDSWYEKDKRFKGPLDNLAIDDYYRKVKYTFLSPGAAHWVTQKFWEMVNVGCIPFLSPVYDDQHCIKCPAFLRVNSPKEFKERIEYLERRPDSYKKLLGILHSMLLDSYYNGEYVNQIVKEQEEKYFSK